MGEGIPEVTAGALTVMVQFVPPGPAQFSEPGVTVADAMTPAPPFALVGTFAGPEEGLGPVSWTKLTVAPFTKPLPVIVTGLVPVIGAEEGVTDVTEGTVGCQAQSSCVWLWPQKVVRLHEIGPDEGVPIPGG